MRPSNLSACTLPLLFIGLGSSALAQQPLPVCGKTPAILQSTQPNIFSEQQEQWLGEAMADHEDSQSRPIKDPALNAYLNTIGARLLANLPPTQFKFQFRLVESSDINGFSLAGGRVYLTRKLVASAHNEDEIAGVIGHEMGHILTHQFAIETTADLRRLLGITSVGDRTDIYAKFQRLVDAQMKDKHPIDPDSDVNQDAADRVAVYAVAAAGYRPQAYAEFWDRSFFAGGKTGSAFSDFFHQTTPTQKRLRKIRGIIAELPPGCGTATENASADFHKWQDLVLKDQAAGLVSTGAAPNSTEVRLDPPLRLDIDRLRFSRDGKYILAQDESSIFVLSRDPFKELFRFDAERALPAEFSPDSQQISFSTPGLHIEQWSIAQQKLIAAHELVTKDACLQTVLAPDGRTLACITYPKGERELRFSLMDVETGQIVFENKGWFHPNFNIEFDAYLRYLEKDNSGELPSSISADGNILLIGPGAYRLAFDFRTRAPIKLGGALTNYNYPVDYCFAGNDRIYAINSLHPENSGAFSFPDGKLLRAFKLAPRSIDSTTGGEYVITSGPPGAAVAIADVFTLRMPFAAKTAAVDVVADSVVNENLDGSLYLTKLGSKTPSDAIHANLPVSQLAALRTSALSPDGRYLAISARTRGGIWDMNAGKQIFLVYGFRSCWWTPDGRLLAELSGRGADHPRAIGDLSPATKQAHTLTYKLPEKAYLGNGHLFEWKSDKRTWTFAAYSPANMSAEWIRQFTDDRPGYTLNDGDNDLIFSYLLQSSLAKEKLKTDSTLKGQADAIKQKAAGRLIEIVNSADGTTRAQVVVEVPLTYEGVNGFNHVGDLLYLSVGDNRTIVYSLKTGAQLRQIFGYVVDVDQASQTICITNRHDETIVLDRTGAELQHLTLGSPLRFASLRDHGTLLLTLTADQRVRRFTINPATPSTGAGAQ